MPNKIERWGFIAIDRQSHGANPLSALLSTLKMGSNGYRGVAAAFVSLAGDNLEKLHVDEVLRLSYDSADCCEKILALSAELPFEELGCDIENYEWLNGNRQWSTRSNHIFRTQPERRNNLPHLKQQQRDPDPTIRQLGVLQGLIEGKELSLAEHLANDPVMKAEMAKVGNSVVTDAIAGAAARALKMKPFILSHNAREAEEIQRQTLNQYRRGGSHRPWWRSW